MPISRKGPMTMVWTTSKLRTLAITGLVASVLVACGSVTTSGNASVPASTPAAATTAPVATSVAATAAGSSAALLPAAVAATLVATGAVVAAAGVLAGTDAFPLVVTLPQATRTDATSPVMASVRNLLVVHTMVIGPFLLIGIYFTFALYAQIEYRTM